MGNQHAKTLTKTNTKLTAEIKLINEKLSTAHTGQVELKEELKMKQATYVAEVQSRLQYQKALQQVVELLQNRCSDESLLDDILGIYEMAEAGEDFTRPSPSTPVPPPRESPTNVSSSSRKK